MQTWIRWLTNEKDGKGNEEQENMGNQVEGVHEAAIVQHVTLDFIGREILVAATKRPLHATSLQIHTNLESLWVWHETKNQITLKKKLFQEAQI